VRGDVKAGFRKEAGFLFLDH